MNLRYLAGALALSAAIATAACGDDPPPTTPTPTPTPTPPPPANPVLTAPRADFPAENDQLQTLRPTLRVLNATADIAGSRSYEFQISDDPDFAPAAASSVGRYYRLVVRAGQHSRGRRRQDAVRRPGRPAADDPLLLARPRPPGHGRRPVVGGGDVPHQDRGLQPGRRALRPAHRRHDHRSGVNNVTLTPGPRRHHQQQRVAHPLSAGADGHGR